MDCVLTSEFSQLNFYLFARLFWWTQSEYSTGIFEGTIIDYTLFNWIHFINFTNTPYELSLISYYEMQEITVSIRFIFFCPSSQNIKINIVLLFTFFLYHSYCVTLSSLISQWSWIVYWSFIHLNLKNICNSSFKLNWLSRKLKKKYLSYAKCTTHEVRHFIFNIHTESNEKR